MINYGITDCMTQPLYDTARIVKGGRADLFVTCVGQGTTAFGCGGWRLVQVQGLEA